MSKKTNNEKMLEVRFVEVVNSEYFGVVKFFDKVYKKKNRSDSVRLALRDLKILYDFFNARTFEGLIKKIGMKVRTDVEAI